MRWNGEAIDGILHPRSIKQNWTAEDLAAIGLYAPVEADPIPEGKISTGQVVERVEGVVKYVHTLEDVAVETRKVTMRAAVNAKLDTVLTSGYSYDFGAPYGVKVLQTRNVEDRTNWLTSQAAYSAAVASGAGSVEGATFRTEDNSTITLSYADGLNVLLSMAAWGAANYAASWSLKDAIAAAEDDTELDAIDIEQGWPGSA